MERWIEGPVFHLKHIFGTSLDRASDGLAMGGAEDQGS
jgi:hypothetical protein